MADIPVFAPQRQWMIHAIWEESKARAAAGIAPTSGGSAAAQGTPDMTLAVSEMTSNYGTTSAGNVTIDAHHDTLARIDVLYQTAAGAFAIWKGDNLAIDDPLGNYNPSTRANWQQLKSPYPKDGLPAGVPMYLIYVGPAVTSITNDDIYPIAAKGISNVLPLTGGTMTGALTVDVADAVFAPLLLSNAGAGGTEWVYGVGNTSYGLASKHFVCVNDPSRTHGILGGNYISGLIFENINRGGASSVVKVATTSPNGTARNILDDGLGDILFGAFYIYDGTTLAGLLAFITANGAGTYMLNNALTASEGIVFNLNIPVKIMGPTKSHYSTGAGGLITTTQTSGVLFDVQDSSYLVLENLTFYHAGTENVTMLKYSSTVDAGAGNNYINHCWIKTNGSGIGLDLGHNAGVTISHSKITGNETLTAPSTTGTGIKLDAGIADPIYEYVFIQDTHVTKFLSGINVIRWAWLTADEDSGFGACRDGVLIDPATADLSVRDMWFLGCLFDYNSRNGVRVEGTYQATMLHMEHCHIYCTGISDYAAGISANNISHMHISDCIIIVASGAGANPKHGINCYAKTHNVFIHDCYIECTSNAIEFTAQTGGNINDWFQVAQINANCGGNSVVVGTGNKNYTIVGVIGPAISDSGSASKYVAGNIVPV